MSNIIKGVRNLRGYTQEELAKEIGMSTRTFCKKEANPETFTVAQIKRIAEVLDVKEDIFFDSEVTVTVT